MENINNNEVVLNNGTAEQLDEDYFFIPLDCSSQADLQLNNEEFARGLKEFSYVSGAITSLCNSGLKPSEAIDYIMSLDAIRHNLETTKIGAKATVDASKYAFIKGELDNI